MPLWLSWAFHPFVIALNSFSAEVTLQIITMRRDEK
jgi:hypothetical protein